MINQLFFSILLCAFSLSTAAQPDAQKKIPPFKILLSNGTYFSPEKLTRKKPVVLIYFAPDCDHCRAFMQSFFKNAKEFENSDVVMITFKPLEDVVRFVYDNGLAKYPNIQVGTEGNSFFLRNFYKLTNTPFVAIYSKDGQIIKSYRKISSTEGMIADLKKIK